MAVKVPTNPWNSTSHFWPSGNPEQYNVAIGPKKIPFTIIGRAVFNKDNLISQFDFNLGNVVGILSLLQQLQSPDPFYQLTAFCLTVQDACRNWATSCESNLEAFGYGDPTLPPLEFKNICLGAIAAARMPSNGSPFFEANSFVCRAYHVGMAFIDPDIHCPHSALHSTSCTGKDIYSCQ